MKGKNKFEKELYDESDGSPDKDKASGLKDYTRMTSVLGGLFFSGVGYTIAATGYLIKDLISSLYSELPIIYNHISDGVGYNLPSHFSDIVMTSLSHANEIGGIAAAVGMVGGTVFFGKLRNSVLTIFRR